uniref:Uncharacterized protein n=1 Tax=Solanum lycopersicum TaxID=4081 RepID=A0A3Q7H186_SOLLC
MGAPLHRKPFHGPIRFNTSVPLLLRTCGYPVGSILRVNSPGAGSLSLFHAERLPESKSTATGFWTDLELTMAAVHKNWKFVSISNDSVKTCFGARSEMGL